MAVALGFTLGQVAALGPTTSVTSASINSTCDAEPDADRERQQALSRSPGELAQGCLG